MIRLLVRRWWIEKLLAGRQNTRLQPQPQLHCPYNNSKAQLQHLPDPLIPYYLYSRTFLYII